MAHLNALAGLGGSGGITRSMHWGGKLPRGNVTHRRTRESTRLYRGTGVMFDELAYAIFLDNMQRNDLDCMMRARSGNHLLVRDPGLARRLDSETGVGLPLHFRLTGECEGHLALPRNSQWRASAIITTRKGVKLYRARHSQFLARAGSGSSLFVVWPQTGRSFKIEGVEYRVVSQNRGKRRHRNVALIERVAPPDTNDLVAAA